MAKNGTTETRGYKREKAKISATMMARLSEGGGKHALFEEYGSRLEAQRSVIGAKGRMVRRTKRSDAGGAIVRHFSLKIKKSRLTNLLGTSLSRKENTAW